MKTFTLIAFAILCLSVFFSTTTNSSPINSLSSTSVLFTFDGLQVLAFGNPDKVTDGILDVHHHTPKLEIKQIEKGKEKVIFTAQGKELYQKVLNISIPNNTLKPNRYTSINMNVDKKDFRWCLDMENDLFQKQLYLNEDKLFTKIHFGLGTFFTSELIDGKYQFVAGSKVHSFNRQIGAPGAKVELQQGDDLIITGLDKAVKLAYQIGVDYRVDITNLPPKEMASIDHFGFYYDVFKDKDITRYMPVEVAKKASLLPRPYLCEAITLSKSFIK